MALMILACYLGGAVIFNCFALETCFFCQILCSFHNNPDQRLVFIEIEIMKPMGLNSTPFISYHSINVKDIDILDDAWGLNSEFSDVINLLRKLSVVPEKSLTEKLIEKIREQD